MEPQTASTSDSNTGSEAPANSPAVSPPAAPSATTPRPSYHISPDTPHHINTESTLAPTSEYMRYLLAAWGSRYLFRGLFDTLLTEPEKNAANQTKLWYRLTHWVSAPGRYLQEKFPHTTPKQKEALAYATALGIGSLALTLSYSGMVYKDIKNLYTEAVADEFNKRPEDVTFRDISRSQNRIIKQTMNNFWGKLAQRVGLDLLFFPAAMTRKTGYGDFVLGLISGHLFLETWKRKTTMFEDLVTFVNNKINPHNGLGQPISQGEIFDLYQHYNEKFHPDQVFSNVLERGTGEGVIWAQSQPIFSRIAELMNRTYAYKHPSQIDPATGHATPQANLTLPKLIFLLGQDLINTRMPERSLIAIELANERGIPAVKEAVALWKQGATDAQILEKFQIKLPEKTTQPSADAGPNGVIAKGSTMQLDAAPSTQLDASSIARIAPEADLAAAQPAL